MRFKELINPLHDLLIEQHGFAFFAIKNSDRNTPGALP